MKKILLLLMSILLFASCSVYQTLDVGGKSNTEVIPTDFFRGLLDDLSSWNTTGSLDKRALFAFASDLMRSDFARDIKVSRDPETAVCKIGFSFDGLDNLVNSLSGGLGQQVLSCENGRFELNIDMDSYPALEQMIPLLSDPDFAVYGPRYNNGMTEENYLEMIEYILGESGPEAIRSSVIEITVVMPDDVLETNGVVTDEKTVCFSVPLLDFLLLNRPIRLFAECRASS